MVMFIIIGISFLFLLLILEDRELYVRIFERDDWKMWNEIIPLAYKFKYDCSDFLPKSSFKGLKDEKFDRFSYRDDKWGEIIAYVRYYEKEPLCDIHFEDKNCLTDFHIRQSREMTRKLLQLKPSQETSLHDWLMKNRK